MARFRLLLLLLMIGSLGQSFAEPRFLIRSWRSEEGLPGNVVRSIDQGSDGFLWIATAEGFARFDGQQFQPVEIEENENTPADRLFRVFALDDGSVWVSSYRGQLFKLRDGKLHAIAFDRTVLGDGLVSILFLHQGNPHFHYNDRLWRLMPDDRITAATMDPDLEATFERALLEAAERGRSRDHNAVRDRLACRDGGLWSIEQNALVYRAAEGDPPVRVIEDADQDLAIADLLEDREGNVWIASPVRGLVRLRHRRVTYLETAEGIYDRSASVSYQSADGTWWIGPRTGGIDRIRDGKRKHLPIVAAEISRPVSCIFEDRSGRFWIGTRDASLYELDPETGSVETRFTRTPQVSKIRAVIEDSQGRLWFGGRYGLACWDGSELETFADEAVLVGTDIACLAWSEEHGLLGGTEDGRVFHRKGDTFELLRDPGEKPGAPVSSIVPGDAGELWISTLGEGLLLLRNGEWHVFGPRAGLPDSRLTALALAGDDALWLGSLGGIIRVTRPDLLHFSENPAALPQWLTLDRADGMTTRECIGGGQPAVSHDRKGRLWFPTSAGLAGVNPDEIRPNRIPPPIHFRPIEVNGNPVALDAAPLVVGPGRVRLGFRFIGISLGAPEKVSYRVQLGGLDPEPQWIGHSARADYQAVPPGDYTFRVSAINEHGIASTLPAEIRVVVRAHFWETTWFIVLAATCSLLLAVGIGWLVARGRMKRKLREIRTRGLLEAERSRISRDLHDELGASLTELSILSALANENPDDRSLRPSLDQLTSKAQQAVGELDEIVWATNPSQDSLRSLVEYLDFSAQEFLKTVGVPLQSAIQPSVPDISIGPRRRHNVVLATREALNNAVKHGNPKNIRLEVRVVEEILSVRVTDDGDGFHVDYATSGDGLTNLRRRMTVSGGSCEIESRPGEGTTVLLQLPLPDQAPSS